jgi:hypothetical protein
MMDTEQVKQINSLRFSWHEQVLRDANVRKHPTALVFAGHVMHQFSPTAGYASISLKAAAHALDLDKTSIIRARNYLVQRGWLQKMPPTPSDAERPATRYTLAGGPNDLVISHQEAKTIEVGAAVNESQLSLWQREAFSKTGVARDT